MATVTVAGVTLSLPFSDKTHLHFPSSSSLALNNNSNPSPSSTFSRRRLLPLPLSSIATPNSVLSEEAFKGLGFELEEKEEEGESDYASEDGEEAGGDDDDLAVPKLGLPQKLVDSLLKRGIAELFPIQRAVFVPALEGRDLIACLAPYRGF